LKFNYTGGGDSHINWRFNPSGGDRRYIVGQRLGETHLRRFDSGNDVMIGQAGAPAEGWHLLEISFYDGAVAVYLDGQEGITWTDPDPLQPGTIGLEPYAESGAVFYYDDLAVCGLSAPFQPIPRPQTGINLTVSLVDREEKPLPSATINVAELGNLSEATQVTDESGAASWTDLPGETATLSIQAPGYYPLAELLALQAGENALSFTLERDTFGLTVGQACRPEEKLLYVDDFQDGQAQGWDAIEMNISGWTVGAAPDTPENQVIMAQEGVPWSFLGEGQAFFFNNVVWRLKFNYTGTGDSHINFRFDESPGVDARYIIAIGGGGVNFDRLQSGEHQTIKPLGNVQRNQWHFLEIGYFDGVVTVFLDGKPRVEWTEANPWPGGRLNLEPYPAEGVVFYYDDFSVCELSAPLATITAE
jgi:hypothetical protein